MEAACRMLLKVEVHAHMNGCVREATLLELAAVAGSLGDVQALVSKPERTLADCFRLFDAIHNVVRDHNTVQRIAAEVVQDFAADNVVYLELRTTPKSIPGVAMSKRSYTEAVLAGIASADADSKCFCRLLLSIDRRESEAQAMETVRLAQELREQGKPVVGVDLSGNPARGAWESWLPALAWARAQGLPVTLHCGEIPGSGSEVRDMLRFRPDRLGHLCFLEASEWESLLLSRIPVEVCFTSNLRTNSMASLADHHFRALWDAQHPVLLCTDDSSVFRTTLSREYALAASFFGLSLEDLRLLAENAIDYTFADARLKARLHRRFQEASASLLPGAAGSLEFGGCEHPPSFRS